MATISLRDYLKGIEELIDGGQIDDALVHCRHILRTYPKHVDTYRMMGKAYLEAHQHVEANDLFQRVLSSCPDDFVANIGMSIIREEEANQDASIWHMERAFEAQPSNRPVQDELRRLYAKREGYAPPKVRLTRGALARMYAHGDLYTQSIGELRSALSEDPQRPDLQVLLAEMYFKTKRHAEAIEVCSQLIEKLPYCLYANRVMVDILKGSQRDVEAQPYLERVEELDPYAALTDTLTPVEQVPAESVMLEQLVIESRNTKAQNIPKAWTGTLQLSAEEQARFEQEELPDWLSVDNIEENTAEPEAAAVGEADSVLDNLQSLDPTPAEEPQAVSPFTKSPSAALVDDQVPDWLRELRPATGSISLPEDMAATPEAPARSWTDELDQSAAQADEISAPENLEASDADFPFREQKTETEPETVREETFSEQSAPEEDDNLSWLEGLAAKQGAAEEELLTTPEEREQAKPEWMAEEPTGAKRDILAWLDEMAADSEAKPVTPKPFDETKEAAVLASPFANEDTETAEPDAIQSGEDSTTPTWLRDLSAEVEAKKPKETATHPLEEAPDWLNELRPEAAPELEVQASEESSEESVADWQAPADLSKLDWLEELGPPKTAPKDSAWVPEAELAGALASDSVDMTLEAPAVALTPRRTATLKAEQDAPERLELARQALNFGKLADAADHYGHLLRRRLLVDDVIADLDAAVHRNPADATLWQTLGDAYMRNNQLREALDCYTKAEDLL